MSRAFAAAALALLAGCAHASTAPDFTLTDHTGHAWSLSAQRGTPVELFFGFTHCEDTCPATLAKLAKATATSHSSAEIAFVSVDPQRDTPPVLAAYLRRFDGAKIVGLTGTPAQIARVENAYHVWAQKVPGKRGANDYDEAHIATVFFIDAGGSQRMIADESDGVTQIAHDLRSIAE